MRFTVEILDSDSSSSTIEFNTLIFSKEGAGRKVPIVLCGNKVDLREDLYKGVTCVSHQDGSKLGRQCGALFIEVSPKTGYNVLEALILLTTYDLNTTNLCICLQF